MEESLAAEGTLAEAGRELRAVVGLVEGSNELLLALVDGSVPATARRAVLDHLLEGRVRTEVRSLIHQAVSVEPAGDVVATFHHLASRMEVLAVRGVDPATDSGHDELLGRLGSRNRVLGYAAAVYESLTVAQLEEIEDQLFRFARTVESNRGLRGALGDRDLPVSVRQSVVADLLTRALPATARVVAYAVRAGRARDIVSTLDALVEDAARTRGWRVARVSAADQVGDDQRRTLSQALEQLTGHPVDLRVTLEPLLLGGVVVQIGDLLIDGSTRHRLDQLREQVHASEEAYRVPGSSEGRNTTDG
jgi:F-type H+-transporting ATPase subunit delta